MGHSRSIHRRLQLLLLCALIPAHTLANDPLPGPPCAQGDPLCVADGLQTPLPARTPSVGKKVDGSKPTGAEDTAARLRKQKRDEIKTSAPNPEKAPKPKPKSASKKNPARPDGILDTTDSDGNWTYVFGQNNVSGDRLGACISARAKPWHTEPQDMGCIGAILALDDKFKATLQADSPDDHDAPPEELANMHAENEQQLKDTYLATLTCLNPCLKQSSGANDAQVLFECIDWDKIRETWKKGDRAASMSVDGGKQPELTANTLFEEKSPYACADDALLRAAREGRYHGWGRDPKTGECVRCAKPGWHWSETEKHCVICEKTEHWDSKNLKCVTCPDDTTWNPGLNACVHCTKAGEHWSETEKRCIACEKGEHWIAKESRCLACGPNDHWNARKQTCEGCPDGLTWAPWAGACVHCPNPAEHWDVKAQECAACPQYTLWDAKHAACIHCLKPEERWDTSRQKCAEIPRAEQMGKKLQKEFERTHKCPEGLDAYGDLRATALEMIQQGYPLNVLPMKAARNPQCGYNRRVGRWFPENSFYCTDALTCYGSGNETSPPDCVKFTRKSPGDPVFHWASSCIDGLQEYRALGGSTNVRLIPIAPKVWIWVGDQNGDMSSVHYVFSD